MRLDNNIPIWNKQFEHDSTGNWLIIFMLNFEIADLAVSLHICCLPWRHQYGKIQIEFSKTEKKTIEIISRLTFPRNLSSTSLIMSCHFSSILFLLPLQHTESTHGVKNWSHWIDFFGNYLISDN